MYAYLLMGFTESGLHRAGVLGMGFPPRKGDLPGMAVEVSGPFGEDQSQNSVPVCENGGQDRRQALLGCGRRLRGDLKAVPHNLHHGRKAHDSRNPA